MHEIILPRVVTIINATHAWDKLETRYQGLNTLKTSKLQIPRRDFVSLSMKYSETVDILYTIVFGLISQVRSHGETIEDQRVVE